MKTKERQFPIAILALTALGLTFAIRIKGLGWLLPAMASYIILWAYVAYVLSKVTYVQHPE